MYILNFENFIKRNKYFYIFKNAIVKNEFINKNHDNSLIKDFKVEKITKLF